MTVPERLPRIPPMPASQQKPFDPYPFKFKEIFQKTIWGGTDLKKVLGKKCPAKTGESWELSFRENNVSVVANGAYKGKKITDLVKSWGKEILGDDHSMRFMKGFPLLVKFLGMRERMSLQVHPSDEFAQRYEMDGTGKMEAWYILHAPKDSRVIRGVLPGTTVAEFQEALDGGRIEQCLNVMEVNQGDVIFIPPGTIHTAYGGVVVLEVQQNSDHTYRMTDWDRKGFDGKPRALDVEKALSMTDFYSMGVSKYKPSRMAAYSYQRMLLLKCEKFTLESIQMKRGRVTIEADRARFRIYTVVSGRGKFLYGSKKKTDLAWRKGETFLVPAHLGEFDISSPAAAEIVVSYVE